MTIDERIEQLVTRHEALTEAIELMQRLFEDRFRRIEEALRQDGDHIRGLARIAELRHERLARLEGGEQ